ncbi:hypothetical protein [Geminocystis sp. NIES-3709]|uniref:hypothetical protein n=1 Tax=Geminocystis sp. NIES-3709 TaxID=1617448 RepID=UPI0005FCCE86|nr:hypothetical protein [Geminocystis sp. NIES-3709]BAQ66991.1 hypothetical protein GM3709_3756 [Geminocystis sp. NIES-3709]
METTLIYGLFIITFVICLFWLVYKLEWLQSLILKLNTIDDKGIVLPSVMLLFLPFIVTYFVSEYIKSNGYNHNIFDFLSKLLPLFTFLLGRYFYIKDLKEQKKEIKNNLFYEILNNKQKISLLLGICHDDPNYNEGKKWWCEKLNQGFWEQDIYEKYKDIIYTVIDEKAISIKNIYDEMNSIKKGDWNDYKNSFIEENQVKRVYGDIDSILENLSYKNFKKFNK